MEFGRRVAKFALEEHHSVEDEIEYFENERPYPPKGWIYSFDRSEFHVIPDGPVALRLIEFFAHVALDDQENAVSSETKEVRLITEDKYNGMCDVESGPCACGAWH